MKQTMIKPVLVVDDDEIISMTVASLLREEGYVVVTAANGQEALDCIARERPGLILLDVQMPVMDGWSFAAAYRQTPGQHAPILLFTAAYDAHYRAIEILADGCIDKPFNIDDLLERVAAHASHA